MYAASTIVARNYLAQAHVLVESFVEHHHDIPFHTLVIDGQPEDRVRTNVGVVVLPEDLGLEPRVLNNMIAMYDVMELATALKPAMLMYLIRCGAQSAAYFDPDIRIYAPLDDIFTTAREQGIILTPHTLAPMPRDGKNLTEQHIMQAGMYNLGFIGVGACAYRFLSWWHERLQTDAIVDVANSLFTDQRWIDWVPSLFPHYISRDPGLNAAYWNLHDRPVRRDGDSFTVGGVPLRFFHFSGYDPATPWLLSKHFGDLPRTLLSAEPALRDLSEAYGKLLEDAGHIELRKNPYLLARLPNGLQLTQDVRRILRDVVLGLLDAPHPPPDPVLDSDGFARWLLTPMFGNGVDKLTPSDLGIWRMRPDLQSAFHDIYGGDTRRFLEWLGADAWARENRAELLQIAETTDDPDPRTRVTADKPLLAFGWNVVAYANAELGVGEAGRRTASMVSMAGFPTELVSASTHLSRDGHRPRLRVSQELKFESAIICVNADQIGRVETILRLGRLRGKRIGLWFWELSDFPRAWDRAFRSVHEVWTASEFTRKAIQAATEKPVRVIPLPIEIPSSPTGFTRRSLGLPADDVFTFLTNFDYLSVHKRKNPAGVIRAYTQAFSPSDGARLVVKSINGGRRPLDVEHVKSHAAGRPDILFLDDYVSSAGMKGLIELADVYVSLHRSEGYGLNLADAMAVGTPVIATGYSGNMDFMDDSTATLIPYDLVPVGRGAEPYDPESSWAEPDLNAAAHEMRRLFDDRSAADAQAARALAHVSERYSLSAAAVAIRSALLDPFREDLKA
jgi:glycosyltransferase involved in cell wall biosynthesis